MLLGLFGCGPRSKRGAYKNSQEALPTGHQAKTRLSPGRPNPGRPKLVPVDGGDRCVTVSPSVPFPDVAPPPYCGTISGECVWRWHVLQHRQHRCRLLELGLGPSRGISSCAQGCRAPENDIKAAARWQQQPAQPGPAWTDLDPRRHLFWVSLERHILATAVRGALVDPGHHPRNCLDGQADLRLLRRA